MDGENPSLIEQAVRDATGRILQELPGIVQEQVIRAMNDYARILAVGEVARFKTIMAAQYPLLEQLSHQQETESDEFDDCENQQVAVLGEHGAGWNHLLPFGNKEGQTLIWKPGEQGAPGTWDVGEASGAYDGDFSMSIVAEDNQTKLRVAGGKLNVDGTTYPVEAKEFSPVPSTVFLVLKDAESGNLPYTITLEDSTTGAKVYLEIGELSVSEGIWTISKHYSGGRGLFIGIGLPRGTADYQVPVWNNTTKSWYAGWVTAIDLNSQT